MAWGLLVVLAAGGVGFRYLQLLPYPRGEFNWVDAPNQRHRAYVYVLTDKGFFGGTRELYRMKVEFAPPTGKRIPVFEQDISRRDVSKPINLNALDDVVIWAPDSSRVTYHLLTNAISVDLPF